MPRYPVFFEHKEIPDADLLSEIKKMIKDGKGPKMMKIELPDRSLYSIRRYYTKIRRGIW
jgi:hypothetical protein